jgi:DNA-binding transcriptional regulator YdaS (Cro superfamily)
MAQFVQPHHVVEELAELGCSQSVLATLAGLSPSVVNRWICGVLQLSQSAQFRIVNVLHSLTQLQIAASPAPVDFRHVDKLRDALKRFQATHPKESALQAEITAAGEGSA